jgi:hypothetical protein
MQEKRRSRRIDIDLEGTVNFQQDDGMKSCFIRNINEECAGVMIVTSDPRVSVMEDLNLAILIPAYRTPVKCAGRIAWYSENKNPFTTSTDYAAGIYITDISRIDRRRLELVIAGKREPLGLGSRYSLH